MATHLARSSRNKWFCQFIQQNWELDLSCTQIRWGNRILGKMYLLNALKMRPPTYLLLPSHTSSDLFWEQRLQTEPVFDYASLHSSVPEVLCTCTFPDFNIKLVNLGQSISNLKRKNGWADSSKSKKNKHNKQPLFADSEMWSAVFTFHKDHNSVVCNKSVIWPVIYFTVSRGSGLSSEMKTSFSVSHRSSTGRAGAGK